ncbi:peptidoglycan-binding protein [Flavobacterium noncentrifugens]|nr:peptidoglycan-binding protein [Flavobacterium noncentrifugens]
MPYREIYENMLNTRLQKAPLIEEELMMSCLYFFYIKNVFQGLDVKQIRENNWYLPSEKTAYISLLDTLVVNPELLVKENPKIFPQYYNLRKALYKFREIENKGGWKRIHMPSNIKSLKPGDTAATVAQIRSRLFAEGFLTNDTNGGKFDSELLDGLLKFQTRYNRNIDSLITPKLVADLNIPVRQRIETIAVNMERCRWITPMVSSSEEYIAVNIPSYRLHYFRDGKTILLSRVVVGKELHKTIVFSGMLSYIVFRPYWNVPKSILDKEIKPGIRKNANYLKNHNMEWADGQVRQKPGKNNSLGLVKFMFPNTNNIYLHDSPAKSLFSKEGRAFSHGCIRVEKAKELAIAITEKDSQWSAQKVSNVMEGNITKTYTLGKKIPVYIGYFTAWADAEGNVAFYTDIYKRDNQLLKVLQPTN